MSDSPTQDLCGCLQRIAILLEKGESVQAATVVAEMNDVFPRLPPDMPDHELAEARRLLDHCTALERGLRQSVLASLQRLGATRKALVYREHRGRP
jgi:hypothetical protein